jgi:hypothetical protein
MKIRIQELEKDNLEIKSKLGLKDHEKIPYSSEPNPAIQSEAFKLVSVGTIESQFANARRQSSPVKQHPHSARGLY